MKSVKKGINYYYKIPFSFRYRTVVMAGISSVINLLFAIWKGIAGWYFSSFWMITFAAYYMILCLSKLVLLSTKFRLRRTEERAAREIKEWKAYGSCGGLLMMLTIVLQGMVVLIVKTGNRFSYHETVLLLNLMNLLTGLGVCVLIFCFGGYMVWNAKKNIQRLSRG